MYEIKETGGARIGMANASWPFAKLTVNKNTLILNAGLIGKLVFSPANIISIEPYNGTALFSSGIKINHNVNGYNPKVIFCTFDNPSALINRIAQTGFLNDTDPDTFIPDANLVSSQKQGGYPLKVSATIAIVAVWNLLFLYNARAFFTDDKLHNPLGFGAQLALGFMLITGISLLTLEPVRKLALKEGRSIDDIKSTVYFIMLICGLMLIATFFFPHAG
jgi:hypothetical protein